MNQVWHQCRGSSEQLIKAVLQALMELGATVCTPKSPACASCPLQSMCAAYKEQQEWEERRQEILKSTVKGFFSSAPVASSASLSVGDEDRMLASLAS
jgi:adenine-specific DNA glycosylase